MPDLVCHDCGSTVAPGTQCGRPPLCLPCAESQERQVKPFWAVEAERDNLLYTIERMVQAGVGLVPRAVIDQWVAVYQMIQNNEVASCRK